MIELLVAFVFGITFGSFLNVVILRIPKDQSVVFTPSHCYACNNTLKPWHNIPLFSWVFLKGRCAYCDTKISKQYPFIEFISGVIFVILIQKYSFSVPIVFVFLSFSMLLVLAMIDIKYKMVPDSINLLAIVFALLGAWSFEGFATNLQNALLFAGGFTLLRFVLSYLLTASLHKQANKTLRSWTKNYHRYPYVEAMGEGDSMVAATMGALLGLELTLVAVFLSAVLALPVMLAVQNKSQEDQRVAFVPFLALATFIVYIYDTPILSYIEANY